MQNSIFCLVESLEVMSYESCKENINAILD